MTKILFDFDSPMVEYIDRERSVLTEAEYERVMSTMASGLAATDRMRAAIAKSRPTVSRADVLREIIAMGFVAWKERYPTETDRFLRLRPSPLDRSQSVRQGFKVHSVMPAPAVAAAPYPPGHPLCSQGVAAPAAPCVMCGGTGVIDAEHHDGVENCPVCRPWPPIRPVNVNS